MENGSDPEAVDRLLKPAATEEGENFRIFTHESCADRRVMQNGNAPVSLEFRERLLESHGVIDCFLNELFNERFTPRIQHAAPKPAGEAANAGKTDAFNLDGFAIEHVNAGAIEHFADKLRFAGLQIVIAKHSDGWNPDGGSDVGG